MAKITKTHTISKSGSTYSLGQDKRITVEPSGDPLVTFTVGINELDTAKNNKIKIAGDIYMPSSGTNEQNGGVASYGLSTDIIVARTSEIYAQYGVVSHGANAKIINQGDIHGSTYGVTTHETGAKVINRGTIDGSSAGLRVEKTGATITNDKSGMIFSANYGVEIEQTSFDPDNLGIVTIVNKGLLSANNDAIYSTDGHAHLKIINTGHIYGDIVMGEGNDLFSNKAGGVVGEIRGGLGDDTYIVNSAKLKLMENAGEGTDSIQSLVSYVLQDNFENLTLIGAKAIDATGNGAENVLTGNGANNILNGKAGADILLGGAGNDSLIGDIGMDKLTGGGGNDKLTGGTEADTFIFTGKFGKDTVVDFEDNVDVIKFDGFAKFDTYAEIKDAMKELGNGSVVIKITDTDSVTIDNVTIAMLTETDFGLLI